MGPRYPELACTECGKHTRLIAICENPDTETETRFYECSSAECRFAFRACVPNLRASGWIAPQSDLAPSRA